MEFAILGPLEVRRDGRRVAVAGAKPRAVLTVMLLRAGEPVSAERVAAALWGDDAPPGAVKAVQVHVSRLRRALSEPGRLVTLPEGYMLHVEAGELDVARFERDLGAGRVALAAGDAHRAAALLRDALRLWRGPPLADLVSLPFAAGEIARLEEQRLQAVELCIDADLAAGRVEEVVVELQRLVAEHPLRERLHGQLMLALYRAGRQADALDVYRAAHRLLDDALGVAPGRELRDLQQAILGQDPKLARPRREAAQPAGGRRDDVAGVLAAPGERKQVTVLFADVVDSMELAERSDPEAWQRVMRRLFAILCDGVHRFEGTVDKFTGDGIMALFGAPIAHEDHARRACLAALRMQHELATHADELRADGVDVSVRVGLNSGEVVVGEIGEDLAMAYTAVGHTVGLAQRVEQLARPGKVYLSEHTASLVEGYVALKDLGVFGIKGASRSLRMHELVGVGAARGALDVARARGLSRFVGREEELRALDGAFAAQGQVVGVVGEAGVGKSRLCHEFVGQLRATGVPVYHVAGQAHAKSVPLLPVLELLRTYFEIGERDSDDTARERIAGRLALLDEAFAGDLPLIFDFLGVSDPARPSTPMDLEARQRQLLVLMRRLIHAESARAPGVTLVEDLHWLDAVSEVFLANQIDAAPGTRSLVVLNFRPEYHATWMSRSYYRQIALAPLRAVAIEEMLTDLLGSDPSLHGLSALVAERTGGNPFFIEELVRSLVESGSLDGERGSYRLAAPVDVTAVPARTQTVLAARIDRLARREKAVLQAAAVIGREFPAAVLAQVAGLESGELADVLRELVAREFVCEQAIYPEAIYAFKHPLTREVAYGSQLSDRRAAIHAAVASAITQHYQAERLDERSALVAHHWEAAGETLQSARWHARAAAWAGTNDPAASLRHWRDVSRLAGPPPTSVQTMSLGLTARISWLNYGLRVGISEREAATVFREAEGMAIDAGDIFSQAMLRSLYGFVRGTGFGDTRDWAVLSRQAIALAKQSGDPALHVALGVSCAWGLFQIGEYREEVAMLDRAIDLAGGDVTVGAGTTAVCPYAICLINKGGCECHLGKLEESRLLIEQGMTIAREQGDIEIVGLGHLWAAWLAYFVGQPDKMVDHARRGLEIAERIGSSFSRAAAWYFVGFAHRTRREWQAAIDALERSYEISKESGTSAEWDSMRLAELAQSYLGLGEQRRAKELAQQGLELARARGQLWAEKHGSVAMARVLLGAVGVAATDQIEAELERVLELVRATGARVFEPLIHVERAELAHQRGEHAARERELREAHRLATQIGATAHAERLANELATLAA
jgi:class 3 adenylate cyclase